LGKFSPNSQEHVKEEKNHLKNEEKLKKIVMPHALGTALGHRS